MSWTRRRILLVGLAITLVIGTTIDILRHQKRVAGLASARPLAQYSSAIEAAYETETSWQDELRDMLTSSELETDSPSVPYDRDISLQLIRACRMAVTQYRTGRSVPEYNGDLSELETFQRHFSSYEHVLSFTAVDERFERYFELAEPPRVKKTIQSPLEGQIEPYRWALQEVIPNIIGRQYREQVYFGFLMESEDHYVMVFRGTQSQAEWLSNLQSTQIRYPRSPEEELLGYVHRGFANIATGELPSSLSPKVLEAGEMILESGDPSKPLYIAGHSLGSAIATLAAFELAYRIPELRDQIRLYTYAGPRVGNRLFAESFARLVPNAYRVANVADSVPTVPSSKMGVGYVHVGEPWMFLANFGDLLPNHIADVYLVAVERELETRGWHRGVQELPDLGTEGEIVSTSTK